MIDFTEEHADKSPIAFKQLVVIWEDQVASEEKVTARYLNWSTSLTCELSASG